MSRDSLAEAHNMIAALRAHGELVAQGAAALQALRSAIQILAEAAGFELVFEPNTHPDLRQYFAVAAAKAAEGALKGALLGLVVGALTDHPAEGVAIGAGLGVAVGVAQGIDAVDRGYRVRARYLPSGALQIGQV